MFIEVAHYCFILQTALSLILSFALFMLPRIESRISENQLQKWVPDFIERALILFAILTIICLIALLDAFLSSDFSVSLVFKHSSSIDPFIYKISALWGNHEGSMFLWICFQLIFISLLFYRLKSVHLSSSRTAFLSSLFGGLFVIFGLFSIFVIVTSNPFLRHVFEGGEGKSLNPMLQDPAFIIHPPLLFLGYASLLVPFVLLLTALCYETLTQRVIREMRFWVLLSWGLLTLAVALGSYWAYYELGWGGWWFWDPVENVSLLPWLLNLALFHALLMYEKKKIMKGWVCVLASLSFILSIMGTFLVRSGLLSSVHSFASDPLRGSFIFGFFTLLSFVTLSIFIIKRDELLKDEGALPFSFFSREMMFVLCNFFLLFGSFVVLLGTFVPLLYEALYGEVIAVGAPYFNKIFALFLPAFALVMFLGIVCSYQRSILTKISSFLILALSITFAILLAIVWIYGHGLLMPFSATVSGIFICVFTVIHWWRRRQQKSLSIGYFGMFFAHGGFGIMLLALGIASSYAFITEQTLKLGQKKQIDAYEFYFTDMHVTQGSNYQSLQADVHVKKDGKVFPPFMPERRYYVPANYDLAETSIATSLLEDALLVLGPIDSGSKQDHIQIRFYHYPLALWIWIGALGMFIGSVCGLIHLTNKIRKG